VQIERKSNRSTPLTTGSPKEISMKTRTAIVTAISLVALAAPTAQAHIPGDHPLPGKPGKPRVISGVTLLAKDAFACRTAKQTTNWKD